MKIDHYIGQLLYRYQCVTVPGFGAFLSEIQPARISADAISFHPPRKIISYNSYLKNNDGLLASHISVIERIPYEVAVGRIASQVQTWRLLLNGGGQVNLPNIGTISLNTEGNQLFEASGNVNYYTSSFGLSAFVSPLVKRTEPLQTETIVLNPTDVRNYSYLKYAAVIVVGLGVFGFFGNDYYRTKLAHDTLVVQSEVQKDVEKKIQEATFFISTPLPNVKLSVTGQKLPYHIVAGAFRNEGNAQRIFERLTRSGFNSRRLPKNNYGLFPVLYGSYATYKEAQSAMRVIHKEQSKEAWLLIDDL